MVCPKCKAQIPAGAIQCPSCGTKFKSKRCPHCNSEILFSATVCPRCRKPVGQAAGQAQQAAPPAKERQGSFRWWRIPIYIVVFAIGMGVGSVYTRYSILSNVKSAFSQFTSSSSTEDTSSSAPANQATPPPTQSESSVQSETASSGSDSGNLGDYKVSILSARKSADHEGKAAVIVKYQFTNNSDENQCFMATVTDKAFQNGVQLDSALIIGDDTYSALDSAKEIQPSGTIEIEQAYLVSDTNSDIIVEVTALFSLSKDKITKTFSVSELQ